MKLYEYQGRQLFRDYGIACVDGIVVDNAKDAEEAAEELGCPVVVKAQVLTGGRGKAGGVKIADSPAEAREKAEAILALTIKSIPVTQVLLVPAAEIHQEYYVGFAVDRSSQSIVLMLSNAGGVDIEELAVSNPDAIQKLRISPSEGLTAADLQPLLDTAFEEGDLQDQASRAILNLYRLFTEKDCSLAEINPFAVVDDGVLKAIDSKIVFDDNALGKHPELAELNNEDEYSADELEAREAGLSFVSMEGNVGCIVNGAGLAMATMDLIKHFGGSPANFLDVGGSSNPEKVLNALRLILRNPDVKAILINIFGGITRCDDIAQGILMAAEQLRIPVPMVIRLIGTNDAEGRSILSEAGYETMEDLSKAVQAVVAAA